MERHPMPLVKLVPSYRLCIVNWRLFVRICYWDLVSFADQISWSISQSIHWFHSFIGRFIHHGTRPFDIYLFISFSHWSKLFLFLYILLILLRFFCSVSNPCAFECVALSVNFMNFQLRITFTLVQFSFFLWASLCLL